jgi:hypothetical protein
MSFKETNKELRDLLNNITSDLEKAENGNKAAAQRVRTGTVRLEKVAKLYRKESISSEKKNKGQKKPTKSAGSKKPASKGKTAAKGKSASAQGASKSKSATVKAKPKAKATTSFRSRQLSTKRASAKLPTRKFANAR